MFDIDLEESKELRCEWILNDWLAGRSLLSFCHLVECLYRHAKRDFDCIDLRQWLSLLAFLLSAGAVFLEKEADNCAILAIKFLCRRLLILVLSNDVWVFGGVHRTLTFIVLSRFQHIKLLNLFVKSGNIVEIGLR